MGLNQRSAANSLTRVENEGMEGAFWKKIYYTAAA